MKKNLLKILFILPVYLVFNCISCEACTRIFWNTNSHAKIVARTMDLFISDEPQMWIQPRGLYHKSEVDENGLEWKSKYGSVVISAFHLKDLVTDGMNEEGLAVHCLILKSTEYEKRDLRPGVHYGQWLQYLLDTCQTVEEAIKLHETFQVVPMQFNQIVWPLHLMLEDAKGDSAIIEFIDGKIKIYHSFEYQVGTNDPSYDIQLNNLHCYESSNPSPLKRFDSSSRFIRSSISIKEAQEPKDLDQALFSLKEIISQNFQKGQEIPFKGQLRKVFTFWTTILDLTHRVYYFFPANESEGIRIEFSKLDFSNTHSVEIPLFSKEEKEVPLISLSN